MRTLTKMLKPLLSESAPQERFSVRIQNGVEIYEHEFVQRVAVPAHAATRPRLVVTEDGPEPAGLVSKARSEIAGLATVLRSVVMTR